MIAHVAEAGEARGRVVLRVGTGSPSPIAIEAALRVARAFNSEVESVFVEDIDLIEMAGYAFASEISFTGRHRRAINPDDVTRDMQLAWAAVQRQIQAMARTMDITVRCRSVRDTQVHAIAKVCAECGPWNVVALAEPIGPGLMTALTEILSSAVDATGLVVVGPKASRTTGPVVLAIEDVGRLGAMLHAADRLAPVVGGDVLAMPLAANAAALDELDAALRLALVERPDIAITHGTAFGHPAEIAESIRRLRCGFVLAALGGLALPDLEGTAPLATTLECPLFLVR